MTRDEHLNWCKERAIEIAKSGDIRGALTSMMSDLGKHSETRNHSGIMLTGLLMIAGRLKTIPEVIQHIEGFN